MTFINSFIMPIIAVFTLLIRSLAAYLFLILISLICVIPIAVTLVLPAPERYTNKVYFWFLDLFYTGVMHALCVPIKITGVEYLPKKQDKPVIFIGNHQSSLDIPVMGYLCQGHAHVWLILEYYARHPIIGPIVNRMNITVDRDNPIKAARSLIKVINFLQQYPSHLIIFPEGKRFTDGKVHQFFEGFAIIARKTGRAVIPVFMKNNYKIFPPNSILVRFQPLEIVVGEPQYYNSDDTDELFTQRLYTWYVAQENK
jgi:1-acyl-sn-glycerol-3-phosphate acyltransferase